MIYLNFKEWIYLSIENPFKSMKKLKGVFKPLKCYFKFAIAKYAPYPILWVSKPSFIHIVSYDVGWKDKYDTPRFETVPYVWIHIYRLNFIWYWDYRTGDMSDYWEQALWYLYYYHTYSQGLLDKPDIEKAKESWPWEDYETKESSWNDNYLIK